MAKKPPDVPPDKLVLYDKLIATAPDVVRKGATAAYTSRNGHMFSFLTKKGKLALRLPADQREAFRKKYRSGQVIVYDTVMKEYVEVPDALLKRTRELAAHFAASHAYVGSLKPNPTTRKKKTSTGKKTTTKKTTKKKTAKKKTAKKKTVSKKTTASKKKTSSKKKVAAKKTARKKITRTAKKRAR